MATGAASRQGAEEATLAQGFAERQPWAFDEAYRRYGSLLFSVALNVLHNAEEAEDCVHDVLVRIWKNPQAFAVRRGTVRSFLVVCVRNDAISRQRSAARRAKLCERIGGQTREADEIEIADFVEHAKVREALADLPDDQRKALVLAYFGEKTHLEIAETLNEPLGTIKSRISLGLRKLGAALGGGALR